jgi:Flp pilus assembly protein TadG
MKFRNFVKNTCGNTAIMFSLVAVPLMISIGVGIDMIRINNANSILQAATDSAALAAMAGKKESLKDAEIEKLVLQYLAINDAESTITSLKVSDFGYDKKTNSYHVKMTGKIDTTLMAIAGFKTMDVGSFSEVDGGTTPTLEMALVLDVTGSMNAEGRLNALKVASKNLVAKLLDNKPAGADIKIGIVPFARYVNVGMSHEGDSWVSVPPRPKVWSCWDTYPNVTATNCRQVANVSVDGMPATGTHQECDYNYGTPVQQCGWSQNQWYGIVGSRNNGVDTKIMGGGAAYPGLLNTGGPQEITDLTADKTVLNNSIDSLTANDETYIPSGLVWGWELLDSGKPFVNAKTTGAMKTANGVKALVLMTDGDNTISATYPEHYGSDGAVADQKTKELCENIKKGDVSVYTVAFKVQKASSKDMLVKCASSAAQAFDAANDQALLDAFGQIAASLSAMHITK